MLNTAPLILILLTVAFPSQAHDPSLHGKDAEEPNCDAMEEMDMTIAPDDPLMLAMMEQCAAKSHHGDHDRADQDTVQDERGNSVPIMDRAPDHENSHAH